MEKTRKRIASKSQATDDAEREFDLPIKKTQHTLDSDEEDEEDVGEKYNVLDPNDFEGEEDGDLRDEGEIHITPFNMKEELEEVHFDRDGMYIFDKKEEGEERDHWLENIDWVKVEERPERLETSSKPVIQSDAHFDKNQCYRSILPLLEAGETVQKAIRRLGQVSKRKEKGKRDHQELSESEKDSKQKMLSLISFVDQLISFGDMDAYDMTYEQLQFRINKQQESSQSVDIFAEEEKSGTEKTASNSEPADQEETVYWFLRWSDEEDAETHGPFSNHQMIQWRDAGYFSAPAFVKQKGKESSAFHAVARIDFDLYA